MENSNYTIGESNPRPYGLYRNASTNSATEKFNKELIYGIIYFLSLRVFRSLCDSPTHSVTDIQNHVCVLLYRSHAEWQNNITQCPALNSHKTQTPTAL